MSFLPQAFTSSRHAPHLSRAGRGAAMHQPTTRHRRASGPLLPALRPRSLGRALRGEPAGHQLTVSVHGPVECRAADCLTHARCWCSLGTAPHRCTAPTDAQRRGGPAARRAVAQAQVDSAAASFRLTVLDVMTPIVQVRVPTSRSVQCSSEQQWCRKRDIRMRLQVGLWIKNTLDYNAINATWNKRVSEWRSTVRAFLAVCGCGREGQSSLRACKRLRQRGAVTPPQPGRPSQPCRKGRTASLASPWRRRGASATFSPRTRRTARSLAPTCSSSTTPRR